MGVKKIILRDLTEELKKLTVLMLEIVESPEENYKALSFILEQRQQVIDRIMLLPHSEIQEMMQSYGLGEELLLLDSQLRQKTETKYQELRGAMDILQRHKASMGLYRKKGIFAGGVFLDNKR